MNVFIDPWGRGRPGIHTSRRGLLIVAPEMVAAFDHVSPHVSITADTAQPRHDGGTLSYDALNLTPRAD
jgi:hypothetical protein